MLLDYPGRLSEKKILEPGVTEYRTPDSGSFALTQFPEPNALVWADNWFALHSLLGNATKARLIYLDPPYATGMDFQSRDLKHAYADSLGDAAYIEFMRRRLVLLREVLADDGSIYLHIGHQMVGALKVVMDEVFGQSNFRNLITRRKCSSKNFTRNQFANLNDYILFYSKGPNYVWNQPSEAADPEWIAREYPKVDSKGQYKLVPVHAPGVRRGETGKLWRGKPPPPGKHWQYVPSKLDELDAAGEIHWSKNGNPRRKVYLTEAKGIALTDYWEKYRDAHHQSILITGYPTEKNFEMMKMLVSASSHPGDLVLDPFCGSGSTLHAAESLSRKWIGIDQSLAAMSTCMKRFGSGRSPMGDYVERRVEPDLFLETELPVGDHETVRASFKLFVDEEVAKRHETDFTSLSAMAGSLASQATLA